MTPLARGPVVHLIAPAAAGGAESVVHALATAAPDRTRVITLNQTDLAELPFTGRLRASGIGVDEIRCGRRRYAAEAREVARLLEAHHAHLLHTHTYHATLVGLLARHHRPIATVATAHGYLDRDAKERLYGWLDRWAMRRFDATIVVSDQLMARLRAGGHASDRLHLIRNGMPAPTALLTRAAAREEIGAPPDGPLVGWIGRLSIEKGADLFIEAVRHAAANVHAVVIGDGPERQALEARAEASGCGDRIRFVGARDTAARLLSAFDLLVISSRTEGTPMLAFEAVHARLPIVAFAVGGIPAVLPQEGAWLVPPLETDALGRAIDAALADPAERARRADNARTAVTREFSTAAWLARVWALYESVWTARRE